MHEGAMGCKMVIAQALLRVSEGARRVTGWRFVTGKLAGREGVAPTFRSAFGVLT